MSLLSLLAGLALFAVSCSSSDDQVEQPTSSTVTASPTTEPTVDPPSTEAAPSDPSLESAQATWLALWDGAELVVTDPDGALAAINAVAAEDVFERLDGTFNPDVDATEDGVTNSARTFSNNPVLVEQPDGSLRVDDCVFVQPLVTAPSVWYSGVLRVVDGAWQVQELTPEFLQGCTPAAMTDAVFEGYEAYWDARLTFWDPPDPAHPLLDTTTTGSFNEFLTTLLADDLAKGQALRGRSTNFPEIIEVNSEFQVVIFDCQLQDPERGLFDIETGDRLPGVDPVAEGQKDVVRVTMRLVDGVWKVADVQGQENRTCEHAPTTQALPNI